MHCLKMRCYVVFTVIFVLKILLDTTSADNSYVLKAAKNVPRIGRSENSNNNNNNNKNLNLDQMGKFFMKASKSVPRIGRRNENFDCGQNLEKREDEQLPFWSEIADRFAYDPELLTSPEVLEHLEIGDDPTAYNFDKFRLKRAAVNNKNSKFQLLL